MDYYSIVKLATDIPIMLLSAVMIYFVVFGAVGLFKRKRYKKTDKINRFGMIIPARNEEKVVAGLIESIKKNNYPQDMIQIFVIAHNCTDRTAEIAREHGAKTVAITNVGKSPIDKVADVVLHTSSSETAYSILALNSRIAQLAIVDTLYYYVVYNLSDKAIESIKETERSLQSKKY